MQSSGAMIFAAVGLTLMAAVPVRAQTKPAPPAGQTYTGQSVTSETPGRPAVIQPRPIATIGNVNVGIWAPVPLPYNASNNRNLASNAIGGDGLAQAHSGF
nr:hypothetical protein [uncultured Rhodopila sp.]